MALKHFAATDIQLSQFDGWTVLRFFWPSFSVSPANINDNDREFAQAMLIEAIDASKNMGIVEYLFASAIPPAGAFGTVLINFAKAAPLTFFKFATHKDLMNPVIYNSIRNALALNFRTAKDMREMIPQDFSW
jgi:hypothetical protein